MEPPAQRQRYDLLARHLDGPRAYRMDAALRCGGRSASFFDSNPNSNLNKIPPLTLILIILYETTHIILIFIIYINGTDETLFHSHSSLTLFIKSH